MEAADEGAVKMVLRMEEISSCEGGGGASPDLATMIGGETG